MLWQHQTNYWTRDKKNVQFITLNIRNHAYKLINFYTSYMSI